MVHNTVKWFPTSISSKYFILNYWGVSYHILTDRSVISSQYFQVITVKWKNTYYFNLGKEFCLQLFAT